MLFRVASWEKQLSVHIHRIAIELNHDADYRIILDGKGNNEEACLPVSVSASANQGKGEVLICQS